MEKEAGILLMILLLASSLSMEAYAAKYFDLKWNYTTRGKVVAAYVEDLDGDGFKDVVAAASLGDLEGSTGWVYLLSKEGVPAEWSPKVAEGAVSALAVTDLDGDGKTEAIVGVSSGLFFYDGKGEVSKKFLENIYKAEDIIASDINADGKKELVVAAASTDGGKVYAFDSTRRAIWDSRQTKGTLTCAHVSDVDGNGQKETIVGTVGKFDDYPGYVHMYSSEGREAWVIKTEKGVRSVSSYDLDNDGSEEVLVGGKEFFYVLDKNGNVKSNTSVIGRVKQILVADLDGDGKKEILLGSTLLYALDQDLGKKWVTSPLMTEVEDIKTRDINDDGFLEVIVAAKTLYFFDKGGKEVDRYSGLNQYFYAKTIDISDLTDDDYPELIVSSLDASIHVLWSQIQSRRMDASRYYSKAKAFYEKNDLAAAEENVREAKKLYSDIPDPEGVEKSMKLLSDIINAGVSALDIRAEAEAYYENAYQSYTSGDYMNATKYARLAKAQYQTPELNDAEGVNKCNDIIKGSLAYLNDSAETLLLNATASLEQKDHATALASGQKAFEIYSFLMDDPGIERSRAVVDESRSALGINEGQGAIPQMDSGTMIVAAAAMVAAAAVFAVILRVRSMRKRARSSQAEVHKTKPAEQKEATEDLPITLVKEEEGSVLGVIDDIDRDKAEEKHVHRKHLPKISKDSYRGAGISLAGLMPQETKAEKEHKPKEPAAQKEEDISD